MLTLIMSPAVILAFEYLAVFVIGVGLIIDRH